MKECFNRIFQKFCCYSRLWTKKFQKHFVYFKISRRFEMNLNHFQKATSIYTKILICSLKICQSKHLETIKLFSCRQKILEKNWFPNEKNEIRIRRRRKRNMNYTDEFFEKKKKSNELPWKWTFLIRKSIELNFLKTSQVEKRIVNWVSIITIENIKSTKDRLKFPPQYSPNLEQ
jgi:hypothetical protein